MNCVLFAKMDQVFIFKKTLKNIGKMGKNTGKVGEFCQSRKWEPRLRLKDNSLIRGTRNDQSFIFVETGVGFFKLFHFNLRWPFSPVQDS